MMDGTAMELDVSVLQMSSFSKQPTKNFYIIFFNLLDAIFFTLLYWYDTEISK